jgi:hydrogenase maturation protease
MSRATDGLSGAPTLSRSSSRVLVVGYGNTIRGDDGIGWRAVESLARAGVPSHLVAMLVHQLNPELARTVADAGLALFVDAARDGQPGQLRCRPVPIDAPESDLTHQLTPAALMALARSLYGAAPPAFEITMSGERFDVYEGLSLICEAALPRLVNFLADLAAARVHPLPAGEGGANRLAVEANAG